VALTAYVRNTLTSAQTVCKSKGGLIIDGFLEAHELPSLEKRAQGFDSSVSTIVSFPVHL